jgi:ABC-type Fe3+ transport system permease subunit
VSESALEWLDILGKALMWAAVLVLVLAIVGAFAIGTSSNQLPVVGTLPKQDTGTLAVASLGAGITGAGILAGLGAIIRLLVAQRREPGG